MSKNNDGKAEIVASSDLQAFGMIVTAEPYWAVSQPSDVVVMENFIRTDTTGTHGTGERQVRFAEARKLHRKSAPAGSFCQRFRIPLQLREARMAMDIAKAQGAERYAADTMKTAAIDL